MKTCRSPKEDMFVQSGVTNLGARSFVHMKTCRSPKEDFFVQSGGYINNTRNYTSLPTSLSMINEPLICNSFHGLPSNNIPFPPNDVFTKTSENSVSLEDIGIVPPAIFYLNPKVKCFVATFDDPAKGFTTGKPVKIIWLLRIRIQMTIRTLL